MNADKKETLMKNQVVCLSSFRRRRRVKNIIRKFKVSIGKLIDRACEFFSNCDLKPYLTGAAIVLMFYLIYATLRLEMEVTRMHRLTAKIGSAVVSMENKTLKDESGPKRLMCKENDPLTELMKGRR